MSYRIIYDLIAVRWDLTQLQSVQGDGYEDLHFFDDVFLLFELGGDNNVYEGQGRRRARDWSLIGAGQDWEVMREIVGWAASCEGGGMRFSGETRTQAETYIRKCRTSLAKAVSPDAARALGIACSGTIVAHEEPHGAWRQERIARLTALHPPQEGIVPPKWTGFDLLGSVREAALFLTYRGLSQAPIYNCAYVTGPCHEAAPLLKRVPSQLSFAA
ncbi:hypothetical protein [Neokomagataea anthophila]|uniref:Uncharacterized protein n=1 Tax=Neokomagataea anthophila TaxID=2826925 RepID=A0ABS5E9B7_9PROT|nr:hypothetical protein [Neokomagataea anthophila]MBR0560487.1 hypothetical protein [Neokomagataea anthophila]